MYNTTVFHAVYFKSILFRWTQRRTPSSHSPSSSLWCSVTRGMASSWRALRRGWSSRRSLFRPRNPTARYFVLNSKGRVQNQTQGCYISAVIPIRTEVIVLNFLLSSLTHHWSYKNQRRHFGKLHTYSYTCYDNTFTFCLRRKLSS